MNILVTGASGFVGRALIGKILSSPSMQLSVAVRSCGAVEDFPVHVVGELSEGNDWSMALAGQQLVIHVAAAVHLPDSDLAQHGYKVVNILGTLNLARQAAAAGVKRFIFISSIGVNGNASDHPFRAELQPNPAGPYAQSKWEAEKGLWQLHQETGMEIVIIRPPLVYGPGAPGNFGSLVRWIEKGVPLPLGAIHNKRSLVGIDNLIDLIIRCIDHPAAANQVFLAGDGEDLSTTELLRGVGKAMGKPARLIPVPAGLLQLGATVLGKKAMAQRLLGSLQVDISKTCELLDWKPPYTVEEGLRRCFEPTD
ncbi:UDP-glucose 4-epimerase family protein [Stutzerimonas degradans]|uniref:Nucleoside-diphosphate sugar epimerase n=1 Tax=Stutzerimonas degradans TaxID=2968968 RepID=A0A8E2U0G5_9GAMM|nr:SDR family oxidoreductase [Stutzerimonas degradans]MCQ4277077.1 SDR family oxidoreductase [Stutzerimonas degradans]PNF75296.1 nucleoside-diphosphate sugar epimerase [Stutzerimonas degradans]QPT22212.1 SDR family oxidoreductase [Stutzerimonas degradans]